MGDLLGDHARPLDGGYVRAAGGAKINFQFGAETFGAHQVVGFKGQREIEIGGKFAFALAGTLPSTTLAASYSIASMNITSGSSTFQSRFESEGVRF